MFDNAVGFAWPGSEHSAASAVAIGCTQLPWTPPGLPPTFPGAFEATQLANAYLIELAQVELPGYLRWPVEVNLFSITIQTDGGNALASGIGTALIDNNLKTLPWR
jgi:hypothetical protein